MHSFLRCALLFGALGGLAASLQAEALSPQPQRAAAAERLIPVTPPVQLPAADGDLAEWGDLRPASLLLSQRADRGWGEYQAGTQPDAALVRLAVDGGGLVLAVRVADRSLCGPRAGGALWEGDCVEVFLDLRPLRGSGVLLGDPPYTAGVWQVLLAPPTGDGKPFVCRPGNHGGTPLRAVAARGGRAPGGYVVELRLPLASLPGVSPERLQQPFGFALQIDDLDNGATADATRAPMGYSWGGVSGYSEDASLFGCTTVWATRAARAGLLRFTPAQLTGSDGHWRLDSVAAGWLQQAPPAAIRARWRHGACAEERRRSGASQTDGAGRPGPLEVDRWPGLGVWACRQELALPGAAAGRYYLEVAAEGAGYAGVRGRARFYVRAPGAPPSPVLPPVDAGQLIDGLYGPMVSDYFPVRGQRVKAWAWASLPASLQFSDSEGAERAERRGERWRSPWQLSVALTARGEKRELWRLTAPLRPKVEFALPTAALAPGDYDLRSALLTPQGEIPLEYQARCRRGRVTRSGDLLLRVLEARPAPIAGSLREAPVVCRRARLLGNPGHRQFPLGDMRDAQARSVHDLQLYAGRLYVGVGDWNENRGPIDILSFAPPAPGAAPEFTREFCVDDESVDRFRVYGDTLYVPGIDARESWDLGNYYCKREGRWTKQRAVPNGLHVLDVAAVGGTLYAAAGTELGAAALQSDDGGRTWRSFPGLSAQEGRFWQLCPLPRGVLAFTEVSEQGVYLLAEGRLQHLAIPLSAEGLITQSAPFRDGCVYLGGPFLKPSAAPLCYLTDPSLGGRPIACLRERGLTDLLVREDHCYVLATARCGGSWQATVYRSGDLQSWEKVAEAKLPALPTALEVCAGRYYVGLSNQQPWQSADAASGEVWEVAE